MKRINITIPDNLTPNEEVLAIAKQLGKKLLPSKLKMLGSGYELKHLQTQINIKREAIEKPIVTRECPICKTIVDQKAAKVLWTNYGGNQKKNYYCSDECRETVLHIAGNGRASIKKNELARVRSWL